MMKKKSKIILIFCSFALALLTMLTISLCISAMDMTTFTIENVAGDNYITGLKLGETQFSTKYIAEKYHLELKDKKSDNPKVIFKNEEKIEIETSKLHNIGLFFEMEKDGEIRICYSNKEKTITSTKDESIKQFFHNVSMTNILFKMVQSLSVSDCLITICLIILITFIYEMLLNKLINIFISIKNKKDLKIRQIIYLCLVYFFFNIAAMLPIVEILHKFYCIIILIQIIAILYYLKNIIKDKLHNIFVMLAIIFSVNMLILLPAFHVPDEYSHYIKAYSLFDKDEIEINKYIPSIKISDLMYETFYKYNCDLHNPYYKTTIKEYFVDLTKIDKGEKNNVVTFYNTYSIRNFAYIPSAIIIKFAFCLNLPIILSTVLARLINALIFIILGYFALKLIPRYKRLLFTIMLMPITIQQTAAINQDSITLSIIFIFLALLLNEIYSKEKNISNKTLALILVLSVCLGISKPGYFAITLMTILIPKERFKNKNIYYAMCFLPITICAGLTASKYLSQFGLADAAVKKIPNMVTVSYVLKNPLFLIKVCFYTLYQRGSLDLLTGQLNLFGWSTVSYDFLASYVIYFIYTFLIFFDNKETKSLSIKNRICIVGISIITIGLIYASALFGFNTTTTDAHMIGGLQSRYFIPVTLLLAIGFSNSLLKINIKNKNLFNIFVIAFTILVSFYTILSGFYQ